MPNLEPAIEQQMIWENPNIQNGRKTMPIGPIKWEEGTLGEMQAWGVGSENGTPRRSLIFTIPKPVGYTKGGPTAPNTPAFQIGDPLTTVGTATHPLDTDETDADLEPPPSDSDSPPSETPRSGSVVPSATPASSILPIREGTSETKYEQQNLTHAAGQLAYGTPQAATIDHGHGDKAVTMEPRTVGQAPKETPFPEPAQSPAPGYLEQAQTAAASASAAVTSTVGGLVGSVIGGRKEMEEEKIEPPVRTKSPEEKEMDRRIDAAKDTSVEAFLREQSRH